jgi:predicted nucleic acid-binding protein
VKAFLDTNIWISGLVFSGLSAELITHLIEAERDILTSDLVMKGTKGYW